MKLVLIIFCLIFSNSIFGQNVELIEVRKFQGAIFSKKYNIIYQENPSEKYRFTPNRQEIIELENELKRRIRQINKGRPNQGRHYGPVIHKRLRKYIRQYIGYIDEKGNRILHINFIWNGYSLWENIQNCARPDDNWKNEWQMIIDGGSRYWTVKYNIDKNEYFDLYVNGIA